MTFRAYDILANLVPGILLLLVIREAADYRYDKDLIAGYTVVAFLVGYFANSLGSWLEDFYFWTWGGKPSSQLLNGKDIWKVKFYEAAKAKELLVKEWDGAEPDNDQLFAVAKRNVNSLKDTRISDFNGTYAFSRVLLTVTIVSFVIICATNYANWRYYAVAASGLIVIWLRCKQQAYYYAREVLNEYIKLKIQVEEKS